MSFGYSIGDIVSLVQLAWKTVQNSKKACGEHYEFTREASSLYLVIQHLEKESSKSNSPINYPGDTYKEELRRIDARKYLQDLTEGGGVWQRRDGGYEISKGADDILYCLPIAICEYGFCGLYRQSRTKNGEGRGDIKELRITINRITARLSSMSNREGSILTTYEDNDKAVWKEFRKELYREGFSSSVIEKHKQIIKAYIKELADRGLLDDETSQTFTDNRSSTGCREVEPSSGAKSSSMSTSQLSPRPESVDQYFFRSGASKSSTNASPSLTDDEYPHNLGDTLEDTDIEEELPSGAEPSFSSKFQLSPQRESGNQYSFRSETSKSSINANPRLLETVENAIRRLIMPELETLEQEQKVQQSRQEFDRGRSSDSPFERGSERAISVETLTPSEEKSLRKRIKGHRSKDAAAGATVGGILTAAALNRHNMRHKSKGSTRVSQAFQEAEGGS